VVRTCRPGTSVDERTRTAGFYNANVPGYSLIWTVAGQTPAFGRPKGTEADRGDPKRSS
jgi:hypothetical protein